MKGAGFIERTLVRRPEPGYDDRHAAPFRFTPNAFWLNLHQFLYVAGEAMRRAVPGHLPHAEKNGMWARGQERLRGALEAAGRPWLDGKVTSEQAITELVMRAAGPPAPVSRKRR